MLKKVMHLGNASAQFKYTMTKDESPVELETTTLEKEFGVYT